MTGEQLEQLTAWAGRLRHQSEVPEARAAARAVLLLAAGDGLSTEQVDELSDWARRLRTESDVPEARAAARAILLLAEHRRVDSGARNGDAERPAPTSVSPAAALAERLRRGPPRPSPLDGDGNGAGARAGVVAAPAPRDAPTARRERAIAATPADDRDVPDPGAATNEIRHARRARTEELRRRRRAGQARLALVLGAAVVVLGGGYEAAARVAAPDLDATAPGDAFVNAADLATLTFSVRAGDSLLERIRWEIDGRNVTGRARREGERFVLRPRDLTDGSHTVAVRADGPFPGADASETWRLAVDTKAPTVVLGGTAVEKGRPVRITGRVEPGARVHLNGRAVTVRQGRFTIARSDVPRRPLQLVAADGFGNAVARTVRVQLIPRRPPVAIRGVHVTSFAWADDDLRKGVLDLVAQGRINTVELDLKDEAGIVGFDADVPLGKRIGAVQKVYDLQAAVRTLHARGVWVVGRLVAFRDPIHARAAWNAGRRDEVVQTPDGGPYAGYGGFTNFANPAVRAYNIAVAKAAAEAGVDDILYDYIRRPDGPTSSMRFPGLRGTPERAIAGFLAESRRALRRHDVFVGASVFGVAATRPEEVAQDIPRMAREVDYIAPMLYPSHWGPGEYDVANPNGEPYAIIRRSLADFERQTKGTGARVVPWLQDFSLGVDYGPAEVRAQIRAARDAGVREWLLWDPLVTYTADALDRDAKGAKLPAPPTPPAPQATAPTRTTPTTGSGGQARTAAAVRANELGQVPVIMYHQIRADGGGDFDLTPAEFRAELTRLYREGYRPVRAVDLVTGRLNVPAGKSPVVLTFDDSTKEQLAYTTGGRIKPDTAIGIMLDFARTHPGFEPAGTFFVNREPFAGVAEGGEMLRWLVDNGFELGNHTNDHIPLNTKDATAAQQALVLGQRVITDAIPGTRVRTLSLPLGAMPDDPALARRGAWGGESYRYDGVFLVGAEPAPSPFSKSWSPGSIPRIRAGPWGGGEPDYGAGFWLDILEDNPERRYVSDGDPNTIAFPRSLRDQLRPRFQARAKPY